MVTIRLQEEKVLLSGNEVAASERCLCLCNAECLSITFDGFGPGGDPCIECDNLDGTYTLERRGTDNSSGPWVYSYCGESTCLVSEEPGCLEIVLRLGCDQHTLAVSFCQTVILSATADNDGTACDELTFTGAAGATCGQIGTITTGPAGAGCGTPDCERCCECPERGTPQEWAIADITSGFTILRGGNMAFSNTTIFDIPPGWPTRSWNTAPMPPVLRFGLFVRRTYDTNCLECNAWFPLETWTVTPRKCSGGDWYSEHTFAESYETTSCDVSETLSVLVGPSVNQFNYDNINFAGTVDCEWTNMSNWDTQVLPPPLPWTIALPSEFTPIIVSGALLGDATGAAECETLTITSTGTLGIHITVAETASIDGTVARACSTPCDPGCCEPQSMGHVEAAGNVTIGSDGVNQGKIYSQGTITCEGTNSGGLIEADEIEFVSTGENRGFLSAVTSITFSETSKNYDPEPWSDCPWVEHLTPRVQGEVTFRDQSVNHGSSFSEFVVSFEDDSSHAAGASTQAACSFSDNAVNYGEVGGGSEFTYTGGTGSPSNATSGVVAGAAMFDGADNYGIVEGNATFPNGGRNQGVVEGDGDFTQNGENNVGGVVKGNASFGGQPGAGGAFSGWNYGTVQGNAEFSSDTANYGTVNRNATFGGNSVNFGTVMGNATFNGNSSNLGTVFGTITCNTTGTC